jgi:hypothetical protein
LRFNSADSAYLARTTSASFTSQRIFTFSFWCKRSTLSSAQSIFDRNQASNTNQFAVGFNANDTFGIAARTSGTTTVSLNLTTSAVFRDTSAWYHFMISVDNTQAVLGDRGKIYVNGVLQSLGTQTATQNVDYHLLTGLTYDIGRTAITNSQYFGGYFAEFHFIDGQALTPSSFGETDAITGRWKAKAYSGTYGTNGFYLSFKDNTSTTTLGYDDAGSNDWTLNNFSVTAGAGNDSLVDSPTNYGSDAGLGGEVRGNYATLNSVDNGGVTLSNGNLDVTLAAIRGVRSSFGISSGKYYYEMTVGAFGTNGPAVGVAYANANISTNYAGSDANAWAYNGGDGKIYNNNSGTGSNASYTTNDVIGIAINMDSGVVTFYKNGSAQPTTVTSLSGTVFPVVTSGGTAGVQYLNFGQRPFAYTAPSGFKALCTQNLTQPTIQKPSKYMDALVYTGTGASNSISSFGFSPDLVWIKNRGTTTDHALYDIVRGAQAQISSNTTGSEVTSSSGLTAFGSAGFTIGTSSLVNTSGTQYVAWSWDAGSTNSTNTAGSTTSIVRANPQAGFSVVSYTGNGSAATIGHGLGATPKMIIAKTRSTTGDWVVGHASLDSSSPWGYYIFLSSTAARNSAGAINSWGNNTVVVPPTSTVFSVGNGANLNSNGITYIAYCFAEIEGYSKFGSYAGNNSTDGPFVWCGFRPKYIMVKKTSATGPWMVFDSSRDSFNVATTELRPNETTAEPIATRGSVDLLSNGFKIRSTSATFLGELGDFIFAAFAESPFKYARAR